MSSQKKLSQLGENSCAVIKSLDCQSAMRSRLTALGIFPGAEIKALFRSIGGDPRAYLVQGSIIALRNSDAGKIVIE